MANQAKSKTTKVTKKSSKKKLKASVNKSTKQTVNADQQFSVFGLMTHSDATPAAGMVVLAYDNDVASQDLLGQAVTDAKGAYAISYNEAQFKRTKKERDGADIVVSILNAQQKVLFTSKKKNNAPAKYELNIQLPIEQLVVRGQVRLPNGSPCAGALVRAFDKDMRSKEPLGKSKAKPITTDKEGRFEITYTAEQFIRAEKSAADILIEARQNKDAKWTATPIRYNAQPFEIINITLEGVVDRGTSEFQRLLDEISPLLDGVTIAQLKENTEFQDITFLSNETGFNKQLIELLKVSAQLAEEQTFLKHEEFYGLIRQKNIPTEMSALIELETDVLRGALQSSARDNIVRQMSEQDFADFVSRVLQLKASRVLLPSKPSEPGSLGDLLAVAVDSKKHDLVAKYYMEHDGATDAFWKDLGADKSIKPNELKALKLTFTLGDLTNKHLPLVRELYQMGKDKPAFADVKGFAQLDEVEWQAILERPQDPNDKKSKPIGFPPDQESIESYARTLNQYIENAFPTAVISNRIKRENSKEGPFKETRSDLLVFFANNPEFSFADTPPNLYLSGDTSEKFREIKNPDALKAQLKGMGRVFNITPRYSEMRALLADNLDSAMAMTRVGERKYADKYAAALGGPDKARESFRRAEHVHATTFNLLMKHSEAFNSPLPYAISGGRMKKPSTTSLLSSHRFALPTVSDYSTLFGSLNTCSCQHCLSLYSPAAYLVDILKFIQDGPLKDGQSPLDAFLARRPDIEHIGLTCKNTNTQLPYVDLTNEILEAAIVPRSFVIAEGPDIDAVINALDNETMPAGFAAAFELKGYSLSNKASVRLEDGRGDGAWIILDKGWAYSVNYQGTNEGFRILAWPQTSWTEDELRANPEHTHDPAYIKLRSTVYPWNLPLNLPMEEMRIYLDHLGVPRYKLMESFFLGNPIGVLSDKNIAFEYLGLTNEEVDIISGVTTGGPSAISGAWDFWGLLESGNDLVDLTDGNTTHAQGDWDIVLQRISIFLQQSGLSYKELLEILGTYFINPLASAGTPGGRLFGIVSTDSEDATTCNLSKLEIRISLALGANSRW